MNNGTLGHDAKPATKKEELRLFLFLVVLLAPIFSVILVGGYGFLIWMMQLVFGPPTV